MLLVRAHHFIIAWNQQCTCTKPCKRTGDADGIISDYAGKSDRCCDTHDKLDHAGSKRGGAVLHTLDGGTVYGQKPQNKVKRRDDCQIQIRIIIDLIRRC